MCGLTEVTCPACNKVYEHQFHIQTHCRAQAGFCSLNSRSTWLIQGVTGPKCPDCYNKSSLEDPIKANRDRAEEAADMSDHLRRIMERMTPEESGQDDETARLAREEWDRAQAVSRAERSRPDFVRRNEAPRLARVFRQQDELARIRYAEANRGFVERHANSGSRREGI